MRLPRLYLEIADSQLQLVGEAGYLHFELLNLCREHGNGLLLLPRLLLAVGRPGDVLFQLRRYLRRQRSLRPHTLVA